MSKVFPVFRRISSGSHVLNRIQRFWPSGAHIRPVHTFLTGFNVFGLPAHVFVQFLHGFFGFNVFALPSHVFVQFSHDFDSILRFDIVGPFSGCRTFWARIGLFGPPTHVFALYCPNIVRIPRFFTMCGYFFTMSKVFPVFRRISSGSHVLNRIQRFWPSGAHIRPVFASVRSIPCFSHFGSMPPVPMLCCFELVVFPVSRKISFGSHILSWIQRLWPYGRRIRPVLPNLERIPRFPY